MAIKKRMRDGTIKLVTIRPDDDNQSELTEDHNNKDKDLEIKRLKALIELLESRIKQLETNKPKEEAVQSSHVMAVAAASTYSCYG